MKIKALPVDVYRNNSYDCTNGGISSIYNQVLVKCSTGFIDVDLDNPPENYVVLDSILGHKFLRPYNNCPSDRVGWMSGGNFAYTSDSRFSREYSEYPLSIHDRCETWQEYDMLSR